MLVVHAAASTSGAPRLRRAAARRRSSFSTSTATKATRPTAKIGNHIPASSGALLKAVFIKGAYVKSSCSAIMMPTPLSTQRYEKGLIVNTERVSERQLNRYVSSTKTETFTAMVRATASPRLPRSAHSNRPKAPQEERPHEDDALDQHAGEDRSLGTARCAFHDALLLGFEGEHQPQQHRGRHVDPEDLHGQDRQRRDEEDGGQHDETLAEVGRQGPGDELGEIVEDRLK